MADFVKFINKGPSNNNDKYNNNQIRDIFDLLRKIQEEQKNMEKQLIAQFGQLAKEKQVAPYEPFKTIDQYKTFEKQLENQETFKNFVSELYSSSEKSYDKFVLNSWRKIFSDELAQQFCWRGTTTKTCIRGFRVTMAIQTASRQKFGLEDYDFDRVTQKHFQYAHDRIFKATKHQSKINITH